MNENHTSTRSKTLRKGAATLSITFFFAPTSHRLLQLESISDNFVRTANGTWRNLLEFVTGVIIKMTGEPARNRNIFVNKKYFYLVNCTETLKLYMCRYTNHVNTSEYMWKRNIKIIIIIIT